MARPPESISRYRLVSRLGSDELGEVFLASAAGDAGQWVVTAIYPELSADPAFRARWRRQAMRARQLSHLNIVRVAEDLGLEQEENLFFACELVAGPNLRQLQARAIERAAAVPPGVAAALLAGVCAGLGHIHERRDTAGGRLDWTHGGVRPDRVLVAANGTPKLAGFGFAEVLAERRRSDDSNAYLAPEQLRGDRVDARTDVYAVGAVLFELLAGRPPFAASGDRLRKAILIEPPPALDYLCPEAPQALVDLALRCLAKSPGDRPGSAAEAEAACAAAARAEAVGAREVANAMLQLGPFERGEPPSVASDPGGRNGSRAPTDAPPQLAPKAQSELPAGPTRSMEKEARFAQEAGRSAAVTLSELGARSPKLPAPASPGSARPTFAESSGEALDLDYRPLPGTGSLDASGRLAPRAVPAGSSPGGWSPAAAPAAAARRFDLAGDDRPLELDLQRAAPRGALADSPRRPAWRLPGWWPVAAGLVLAAIGAEAYRRLGGGQAAVAEIAVNVDSQPRDAEIWLDGLPTGKRTPSRLLWDNASPHLLMLRRPGAMDTRKQVPAGQAEGSTVAIELTAAGVVEVSSAPPGAEIASGEELLGTAPARFQIAAGTAQRLTATLDGYLPASAMVLVSAGATTPWTPILRRAGELQIDCDPPGVEIRVDGLARGPAPQLVAVEADQPHVVQLDGPGLGSFSAQVSVGFRQRRQVQVLLRDAEDRRLAAGLARVVQRLSRAQRELEALELHGSTEYRSAMARLRRRSTLERLVEALEGQQEQLEADAAAHRTAIEDRLAPR